MAYLVANVAFALVKTLLAYFLTYQLGMEDQVPIVMFLLLLPWLYLAPWVQKDAKKVRASQTAWPLAVLVVGLGIPLGIVPADALSYERAHALGSHIVGRLILLGLIVLPLWKGAHHMRHTLIDFGGAKRDALVAPLLYLLATLGSLLAVMAVVRI